MKIHRLQVTIEPDAVTADVTCLCVKVVLNGHVLTHARMIDNDDFTSLFDRMMEEASCRIKAATADQEAPPPAPHPAKENA